MGVPAVSVIIPLYNAEKYLAECLTAILSQTFQDFEVIIVDDCSTDKSVEVVESCREQFGRRLRLARTETNSGSGNLPRNIGLSMASGEYVLFMDADNFVLLTALETLYAAAKKYDADVVYTADCYDLRKPNDVRVLTDGKSKDSLKRNVDAEPELTIDAPEKNLQKLFAENDFRNAWAKFVRRDLLTKNEILFPEIEIGGDYIWSVNVYCHAKRFLRLPTPLYFYRSYSAGRAARKKRKPAEQISYWVSAFVAWFKVFNDLVAQTEILAKNSSWCYQVSANYFKYFFGSVFDEAVNRLYSKETYEILLREFGKDNGSSDFMIPFFFSVITNREKLINKTQKHVTKLEDEIARQKKQIKSLTAQLCPAVSVIIPMYNAEKFIGEALDSILAQTLQNFEVIVVDDCSTDSSYKVVENYIPKFGGRLKLSRMEKNSGAAPAPRNKGFGFSRGEYIFFMDVDDVLTKTALEEMYTLAKDYDADVVYCEKYYMSTGSGQEFINNVHVADKLMQHKPFVNKPTVISSDLSERIHELAQKKFWVTPWQRLVSRTLLAENQIKFPEIIGSDDVVWCLMVLCCAKKFLRVPNICYIRRMSEESFTKSKKSPNRHIKQWMDVTIRGLKFVDKFLNRLNLLQDNPAARYEICHVLSNPAFFMVSPVCAELKNEEIYDIFQKEFSKDTGEINSLVAYLCTRSCSQEKSLKDLKQKLKRAEEDTKKYKQRIDKLEMELRHPGNEQLNLPIVSESKFARPTISVVIPMYNAADFIAECLDSLLIQTFQDFEVIVVDDCSTDKSVAIVESYAPKFNGRLRLSNTEKNSGGGGYVPRNIGLRLAVGEYVFFADADDFLLGSALETFFIEAKEYDADIVYTAAHYQFDRPNEVFVLKDGLGRKLAKAGQEYEQVFVADDPEKNLHMLIFDRGFTTPWSKFIRRDFLVKNEIVFPEIAKAGDHIWTIELYCRAKRVLWSPEPVYFYRKYNTDSVSRIKRSTSEQISFWVSAFIEWLKTLHKLSIKSEILRNNPVYSYEASKRDFEWLLKCLTKELNKSTNEDIYEILYNEFSRGNVSADLTVPFFFSFINTAEKVNKNNLQVIGELQTEVNRFKELRAPSADKIQPASEE